jgi:hypothetical protein
MSAPREFTMNYTFKLVYTDILYTLEISSHESLDTLFRKVHEKFKPHVNYNKYYLDFAVAGQDKDELASGFNDDLYEPLWYEFGEKWRQISFYVRPINRNDDLFHRMDNYNVETIEDASESQLTEVENRETETDTLGVNISSPPGLNRQVESEEYSFNI